MTKPAQTVLKEDLTQANFLLPVNLRRALREVSLLLEVSQNQVVRDALLSHLSRFIGRTQLSA